MRKTHDKFFVVRFPPWLPSPPSSLLAGPLVGGSGSPDAGGGARVVRESGVDRDIYNYASLKSVFHYFVIPQKGFTAMPL
jgi:hypothetical protein